jgi:hypothetical protein
MSKKLSFLSVALLTVIMLTTTGFSQVTGRWIGTGTGETIPPSPASTPAPICPWQEWMGDFIGGEFVGVWVDKDENYGQFRGKIILSSPDEALCKGKWTWLSESDGLVGMGSFEMIFKYNDWVCEGKWSTNYNQDNGTIEGKRME